MQYFFQQAIFHQRKDREKVNRFYQKLLKNTVDTVKQDMQSLFLAKDVSSSVKYCILQNISLPYINVNFLYFLRGRVVKSPIQYAVAMAMERPLF